MRHPKPKDRVFYSVHRLVGTIRQLDNSTWDKGFIVDFPDPDQWPFRFMWAPNKSFGWNSYSQMWDDRLRPV